MTIGIERMKESIDYGCDRKSKQDLHDIGYEVNNHLITSTNNSAWNDNQNFEEIVIVLIDFLGEFLLFLSSIIECEQVYTRFQLQKIACTAERIYQLRVTLLIQTNNSSNLDMTSIVRILCEFASFIRCLDNEQQQSGMICNHPHRCILTQLLNRLEQIIKSCTDCVSLNNNPQVG